MHSHSLFRQTGEDLPAFFCGIMGERSEKMEEMNEIYTYIGNVLNNNMNDNNWETIKFNMQADVDYCGYDGTYTDTMGLVHDLDIDIPIEMDDKIWRLLELTKKNNFVPWNKAVYTLEKNGHFDMTFEWNQALQDEWDNA